MVTETRDQYRWRIEREHKDGSREFVGFADDERAGKLRAAGFVVTEVPQWPWEEQS